MRLYVYSGTISLDALAPVERAEPAPGPYDIMLRMRALSLNYRDLAIARGHYHASVEPPLVPISDGAGEVVAVGSRVTRFRTGELACPLYLPDWIDGPATPEKLRRRLGGPNDGVMAELVCIDEQAAVRVPEHLEAAEAACLPVTAVTAWHSLFEHGTVRPGEIVVVLGTGGVSIAAIQFARAAGAEVIAVTRREEWALRLRSMGATHVVVDDSSAWPARVMALTGGFGVDAVVDVVGSGSIARSIAAVRMGGIVHAIGYAAGEQVQFDMFDAIRHGVTLRVGTAGHRKDFEALARAMTQHRLRPPIDRRFPIEAFRDAFDYLERGGHFGKVTLTL